MFGESSFFFVKNQRNPEKIGYSGNTVCERYSSLTMLPIFFYSLQESNNQKMAKNSQIKSPANDSKILIQNIKQ